MKYGEEVSHCLLLTYASFRFFQRTGAKVCVKHQMLCMGVLQGWPKPDSQVMLKKSQEGALVELKETEICMLSPVLFTFSFLFG